MFALDEYEENTSQLGAFYDDWGDLWGDVSTAAQWLYDKTKTVQAGTRTAAHVADNATNITAWRVNVTTVALGAAALGALYLVTRRRR